MTTAIRSGASDIGLLVNGVERVTIDGTGITAGGNWGKRVAQIVTYQTGAVATGTTIIPLDDTIPQNTEGDQYLSLAITPTNASSTLEIDVLVYVTSSAANAMSVALFKDSVADAIGVTCNSENSIGFAQTIKLKTILTAGTTSATTFKVRVGGANAATTTFNGVSGARRFGGLAESRITIKEYLP